MVRHIGGRRVVDAFAALANDLAALPPEARAAAIAEALRDAHRSGTDDPSLLDMPEAPGVRTFVAFLRKRVAEAVSAGRGGAVLLDQSALACAGQPWHLAIDGEPVLDGRFAVPVADACALALVEAGWLSPVPGRSARLRPTAAGAFSLGCAPAESVQVRAPMAAESSKGLRAHPQRRPRRAA